MFYCEFPQENTRVPRSEYSGVQFSKIVGRYLTVDRTWLPEQIAYQTSTIVSFNRGVLTWKKHREKQGLPLTKEEQQELMIQILKSETW